MMTQMILLMAGWLSLLSCVSAAEPAGYPNPNLLIEAGELKAALDKQRDRLLQQAKRVTKEELANRGRGELVLVDVRRGEGPTIGNALRVNPSEWAAAFERDRSPEAWGERIAPVLGLKGPKATVVVYDNAVTPSVARVWWILKYWGGEDVRLLNGGVKAWTAAGGLMSMEHKRLVAGSRRLKPNPDRHATADQVQKIAMRPRAGVHLIDARTAGECQAGAIPGATNLDWQRLVDPKTGKMRPAKELAALFDSVGIDLSERQIVYCRSGGRSSVMAFALELMGAEQVANYHGSWNEWSRLPNAPIALPAVELAQ